MTGEVASEVSLCTCLYLQLRRPGAEGWGGAGVEPAEWVVEAGRTTCTAAARLRGPAEIKPRAPRARDPAADPGAGVPAPRSPRGGCSWSLRRAQPAASLCSACSSRPFGAFPAAEALPPTAPQKGGRTRPNRAARVRGSINCKWTAGVLETSNLGLEEASEVITQGPER